MDEDLEITAYEMALLKCGEATLKDGLSTPEELASIVSIFWDVEVRRLNDQTGEVEILWDMNDLPTVDHASEAVMLAEELYPTANVCWL